MSHLYACSWRNIVLPLTISPIGVDSMRGLTTFPPYVSTFGECAPTHRAVPCYGEHRHTIMDSNDTGASVLYPLGYGNGALAIGRNSLRRRMSDMAAMPQGDE